jgi:hypothetical protein
VTVIFSKRAAGYFCRLNALISSTFKKRKTFVPNWYDHSEVVQRQHKLGPD